MSRYRARQMRKNFTIGRLRKQVRHASRHMVTEYPQVASKLQALGLNIQDLRRHSAQMISAAAMAGTLLTAAPMVQPWAKSQTVQQARPISASELKQRLLSQLQLILPTKVGPLSAEIESHLQEVIKQTLGINAVAGLDGNHLNTSFGYIGAEQHLPRFPGDTEADHDELQFKGVTPGRGAWGYFVSSRSQLNEDAIQKEKYYVAVQTMYLPNWNKDTKNLSRWYKYRKVLVVNPQNGKSVVAVIADAGPAAWTGKQFGGSPEVMRDLELNTGMQKGAVLLFFVDDQNNTIALGPVTAQTGPLLAEK